MVQIIEEYRKPSTRERFGQAFANAGQAVGKAIPEYMQSRNDAEYMKKNYGVDIANLSPELRQNIMAEELKRGRLLNQAKATTDIDYDENGVPLESTNNNISRDFEEVGQPRKKQGLYPQPETEGQIKRILTPKEEIDQGVKLAKANQAKGIPMTAQEGIAQVRNDNQRNRDYNTAVKQDKAELEAKQKEYGELGRAEILSVYENATPEVQALFRKKGEEAAARGATPAEVEKELAKESKNFKNTIASIRRSAKPPRLFESIIKNVLGTNREDNKFKSDMRIKLAPLLDLGLFDTAKAELSDLGYAPEEVAAILSDLGEGAKKVIGQMPKIEAATVPLFEEGILKGIPKPSYPIKYDYSPEQLNTVRENIAQVFQNDPSVNLVLLRKAFEDKGVDWQAFKDQLNDEIKSGNIVLNDDQFDALSILDEPPLNNLEKILNKVNLLGR